MTSIITKYISYNVLGIQEILGIGLQASRYEKHSKFIKDKSSHFSIKSQTLYAKPVDIIRQLLSFLNPLTPNDHYRGRTAPLTCKRCILYIYSTNICIEYFKHGIYSPFLSLQNAVCFIILTYLVPVLFTFYKQYVLKLKKIIPVPNG